MKKNIVNFIAGPGVGKSLISAIVFSELKLQGFKTELVQEYAKGLVWKKEYDLLNNQYFVSTEQYKMIKSLPESLDFVIVDGSLLLGLYYNRVYPTNVSNVAKTEEMIIEKNAEFNHIYIYLERNANVNYESEGRVHDEEQSRKIDKDLHSILVAMGVPFFKCLSHKDNISSISDYIIQQSLKHTDYSCISLNLIKQTFISKKSKRETVEMLQTYANTRTDKKIPEEEFCLTKAKVLGLVDSDDFLASLEKNFKDRSLLQGYGSRADYIIGEYGDFLSLEIYDFPYPLRVCGIKDFQYVNKKSLIQKLSSFKCHKPILEKEEIVYLKFNDY